MTYDMAGVIQRDEPTFMLLPSVDTIVRMVAPIDKIKATLFTGGARFSFVRNVRVPAQIEIETGEWIGIDQSTGLFAKASAAKALSWPVWQGGANRYDLGEGGVTYVQGKWRVLTNMVDMGDYYRGRLAVNDELVVGALPAAHAYVGKTGLVNLNDQVTGTYFVVAHVEDILKDSEGNPTGWVVINNYHAGYPRTLSSDSTTLAPTTAAPTTA